MRGVDLVVAMLTAEQVDARRTERLDCLTRVVAKNETNVGMAIVRVRAEVTTNAIGDLAQEAQVLVTAQRRNAQRVFFKNRMS